MTKNFFDQQDEPLTLPLAEDSKYTAQAKNSKPNILLSNKKITKTFLIIASLLIFAAGGAYFFINILKRDENKQNAAAKKLDAEIAASANSYIALDPIIVNLSNNEKNKPVYLRLTLTLRASSDQEIKIIQSKLPMIIDNFQMFLTSLRQEDFNNTGGIILLKEELIKRINVVCAPIIIKDVLLKEIMIN